MATTIKDPPAVQVPKGLNVLERYLTLWVGLCMSGLCYRPRRAPAPSNST